MSKLLEQAIEAVRRLPADAQDEIAQEMLRFAADEPPPEAIPPDHLPAVLEGLRQAEAGEFASEAEIEAAFRLFEK